MEHKEMIQNLVNYVLDDQNEWEDYKIWCEETKRNVDNLKANTDHIFAVACLMNKLLKDNKVKL